MPASFPTSIKTFSTKADGETIYGSHINDLQDEVVAIQTELGTDPSGTSYTTVKARIANLETTKLDSSAVTSINHNTLANLTTGDPHTQYLTKAIGTAKGDLIGFSASGTPVRRAVGTNGFALLADSAQASGLNWVQLDHGTHLAGLGDDDHTLYQTADIQVFAREGDLEIVVGKRFRWPYAVTILGISASVETAPTGASAIFDVDKATNAAPTTWNTIYTTQGNRPTITAAAYSTTETVPDTTAFAAGDYMKVDIEQIGSTIPGADLHVYVRYRRT